MKRKITKVEFEALNEVLKGEYEEKNGSYFAKLEDDDDAIDSLKRAKDNESLAHKETKAKLKKFEDELAAKEADRLRSSGDVKALEESWNKKYSERETELTGELNNLKSLVVNSSRDAHLTDFVSKIGKPESLPLFKKCIADRVTSELVDGKTVHRILDREGKPSAMTFQDFEKELRSDRQFDAFIVASRASGFGESTKTNATHRPVGENQNQNTKPLSQLNSKELAAHVKTIIGE